MFGKLSRRKLLIFLFQEESKVYSTCIFSRFISRNICPRDLLSRKRSVSRTLERIARVSVESCERNGSPAKVVRIKRAIRNPNTVPSSIFSASTLASLPILRPGATDWPALFTFSSGPNFSNGSFPNIIENESPPREKPRYTASTTVSSLFHRAQWLGNICRTSKFLSSASRYVINACRMRETVRSPRARRALEGGGRREGEAGGGRAREERRKIHFHVETGSSG